MPPVSKSLNAHGARLDAETETLLPTTGGVFDVAPKLMVAQPVTSFARQSSFADQGSEEICGTLVKNQTHAIAFAQNTRDEVRLFGGDGQTVGAHAAGGYMAVEPATWAVRRLTPTECERLQGVPDGFTKIPWRGKDAENCPDGPRYKALGNSMAVNVMALIGERISAMESFIRESEAG